MTMPPPHPRPAWSALEAHARDMSQRRLRDLFGEDASRGTRFRREADGIFLDFSKNIVTDQTLALLQDLAVEARVAQRRDAMFRGDKVNVSEDRAALHVALRMPATCTLNVDGVDVVAQVHAVLHRMTELADRVRSGQWRGHTGKPIVNIVNIGIGGSDLGPVMAYHALQHFSERNLTFRFISNVDGTDFTEAVRDLNAEETLFVVSSKTFGTLETLTNASSARRWLVERLADDAAVARHFVAVSSNAARVAEFGIDAENMFEFWDWVGGRYSMESAIGLSTMIAIGPENFYEMLAGFHAMDEHFRSAPFEDNLPVLLGLLAVWNHDFLGFPTVGVMPYDQYLLRLPAYLQQLTMESNGKSVTVDGNPAPHPTGAIFWGEPGTNGQHSFYQLIHQGTTTVPIDFIAFANSLNPLGDHHDILMSNVFAQAQALAFGKTASELRADHVTEHLIAHRVMPGNRPSNVILANQLSPRILGSLVALYEHSVFVQGTIYDVDSFDQWGVELGKVLAASIVPELDVHAPAVTRHDSSTNALIALYRDMKADPTR